MPNQDTIRAAAAYNFSMFRKLPLIGFVAALLATCSTAAEQPTESPIPPTLFVQCDYPSRPPKNVVVTGPELVAKDSGYRAWAQVVSAAPNPEAACYNTTVIWISKAGDFYRPLYLHLPVQDDLKGNGIHLVNWSPSGQLLLAESWEWNTEPNDAGVNKRILVFRPRTNSKFEITLDRLLTGQKGKDCFVDFELLGFTASNWVAVKTHVSTWYDDGDTPADKPPNKVCKEKIQIWAVEPETQKWHLLPANFIAIHYAH